MALRACPVVIGKIHKEMVVPLIVAGSTLNLSVSIGVAVYPEDGDQAKSLVCHTDAGVYAIKRSARDK